MIFAVIPAAGKSARMGRPKLALPLGDRTVLQHVVAELRAGGVQHILVVVGPHVPELAALAESAGAHALVLSEETADMRATVEHGLRWLEGCYHPQPHDDWLLVPADHPALDAAVVTALLRARIANPHTGIIVPTHAGQRGHPTLIGWQHVAEIRRFPPGQGLNAYLRQHSADTLELPVASPHILYDLDTPGDYARLLRIWPIP
jgi:molybdenum cofactor cytidylyltransferase